MSYYKILYFLQLASSKVESCGENLACLTGTCTCNPALFLVHQKGKKKPTVCNFAEPDPNGNLLFMFMTTF
jgi:hypothetical protein